MFRLGGISLSLKEIKDFECLAESGSWFQVVSPWKAKVRRQFVQT